MNRSIALWCCALAFCKCLGTPEYGNAAGPLDLPIAAGIAPGDLLINDFFNGWIKFDPASNQLYSLPWARSSGFNRGFAFDLDGSILQNNSGRAISRLHPVTGVSTAIAPPAPGGLDFVILPDGDLILYRSATSSRREGNVWTGGTDSILFLYDRDTGNRLPIPKPQQFSPHEFVVSPTGDVYVNEFFRGIQRMDLATGELSSYPQTLLGFEQLLAIFPNGDLAISDLDGISRFNPTSSLRTPIANLRPFLLYGGAAIDESGNIWTVSFDRALISINGATGASTEQLASTSFFSPRAMMFVPSDWTPPPVPEPSAMALTLLATSCVGLKRVRIRRGSQLSARVLGATP